MKLKANVQLIDPALVRHRRMQLGLTESYLGSLCGVSSSVIRRLESGWPQDDLSARFLTLLAEQLGATLRTLLASPHRDTDTDDDTSKTDARDLGAVLLGAGEPVPIDGLCAVLDWDLERIDRAISVLTQVLEAAGGVVIDNGATLTIADDLNTIDRDTLDAAATAAFARRRPNMPELRAIHLLIHGRIVRREDMDTDTGRTLGRLRNLQVLANVDKPAGVKADPPILSDDVRFSLMLDEPTDT